MCAHSLAVLQVNSLGKQRTSLQKSLDEIKSQADDEARTRAKLQGDNRTLQSDVDRLREQLEEESEARADLARQLQKAQQDAATWKRKVESGEGGVRAEEVDDIKRKLAARYIPSARLVVIVRLRCCHVFVFLHYLCMHVLR